MQAGLVEQLQLFWSKALGEFINVNGEVIDSFEIISQVGLDGE